MLASNWVTATPPIVVCIMSQRKHSATSHGAVITRAESDPLLGKILFLSMEIHILHKKKIVSRPCLTRSGLIHSGDECFARKSNLCPYSTFNVYTYLRWQCCASYRLSKHRKTQSDACAGCGWHPIVRHPIHSFWMAILTDITAIFCPLWLCHKWTVILLMKRRSRFFPNRPYFATFRYIFMASDSISL